MDRDTFASQMQWAMVYAVCFLFSILLQQFGWSALSAWDVSTFAQGRWQGFWWVVVFLPFVVTFILTLRGYVRIGNRFNLPLLEIAAHGATCAYGVLAVGTILSILSITFFHYTQPPAILSPIVYFALLAFSLNAFALCVTLLALRQHLGISATLLAAGGVIILIAAGLVYLNDFFENSVHVLYDIPLLRFFAPVWNPFLEAFIAGCSIFVFRNAARAERF